jgi:hypothetical protein
MSYKKTFEKALLKTKGNIVGTHSFRRSCNQYEDPRLAFIGRVVDSGLDKLKLVPLSILDRAGSTVFKTRKDSTPLGMVISVEHYLGGEIQFACPVADTARLLVSIYKPHNGHPVLTSPAADIYEYTGNIEAANERLVEWLAALAPELKAEIGTILERLDTSGERHKEAVIALAR